MSLKEYFQNKLDNNRMKNVLEQLIQELKDDVLKLNISIVNQLGDNPYKEFDEIIAIIEQKNYKQFGAIQKKIKELAIVLYDRRLYTNEIRVSL